MSTTWLTAPAREEVAAALAATFAARFGRPAEGVWSAPGRVNLIGEHVDYQAGLCLPLALPHRTYAAVARRDDGVLQVASQQSEQTWTGSLADVGPGTPTGWPAYVVGVLWALQDKGIRLDGADILIDGRVPLGSGLSSSAALECCVALAASELVPAPGTTRHDLVAASIRAENEVAGANTGGMDQATSLLAGDGNLLQLDCRDFSTRDIPWRLGDLGWTLLVVDTRAPHELVDGQYAARRADTERSAELLGVETLRDLDPQNLDDALQQLGDEVLRKRTRHVVTEIDRVRAASAALAADDVSALGAAMTASHVSLRDDYEVTVPELDTVVEVALAAGAAGARMTGGGFGGSAIALVRHEDLEPIADQIVAAFAERGFNAPQFLPGPPSAAAARDQ